MLGNIFQPFTSMQELNLDWILTKIKNMLRFLPDDGAVGQILRRTAHGAEWSDEQGAGGSVTSVNGMQGAVVLDASDVGALPDSTVIPDSTSDLINDSGFVDSAGAAAAAPVQSVNGQTGDVVLPIAPVTSVNGQTGAVVLDADDVGALPDSYVAPVTSVNGQNGAVSLSIPDSTSDLLNDSGFVDAAGAAAAAMPTVTVDNSVISGSPYEADKTYTVTGNGVVVVYATTYSDNSNDTGTFTAEIYHNGTLIFASGTRLSTANAWEYGQAASCAVSVSNGDSIRVYLRNSKMGTPSVFRRFMCFGCTIS